MIAAVGEAADAVMVEMGPGETRVDFAWIELYIKVLTQSVSSASPPPAELQGWMCVLVNEAQAAATENQKMPSYGCRLPLQGQDLAGRPGSSSSVQDPESGRVWLGRCHD